MTYTEFSRRLMAASICMFGIADIICLINVLYSVALLYRLFICLCCGSDDAADADDVVVKEQLNPVDESNHKKPAKLQVGEQTMQYWNPEEAKRFFASNPAYESSPIAGARSIDYRPRSTTRTYNR